MKENKESIILVGAIAAALMAAFGLYWVIADPRNSETPERGLLLEREDGRDAPAPSPAPAFEDEIEGEVGEEGDSRQAIIHVVPFTAQAPFGEWTDPRQQDGCEEAASLMAVSWARGESFTPEEAKAEILAASAYQQERYGSYHDTSATDTLLRIIQGYFGYQNARVESGITKQDIIDALYAGKVVIVPTNGRALGNPNFTSGGPDRHMLVIIGYDPQQEVFITNDNGTRQGEGWRYNEDILFGAIRDYATGYHVPIVGEVKAMIAVEKEKQ